MNISWLNYTFLILLLLTIQLLYSCTYSIADEEKKFNPYRTGDMLIFESNIGEFDTIKVIKVDRYYGKKNQNHVAPFVANEEYIGVFVNHTIRDVEKHHADKANHYFLILHKINNSSLLVYFDLEIRGAYSYYMSPFSLDHLRSSKTMTLKIGNIQYNDIILLNHDKESIELETYQNELYFIKSIYWSKSVGYVKIDLNNGKTWFLLKKLAN